jgi:rod shape determining protein RodA
VRGKDTFRPILSGWHFWLPAVLCVIGWILLYSTTYTGSVFPSRTFLFQVAWTIIGVVIYILVSRIRMGVRPAGWHLMFFPIEGLLLLTLIAGWAAHGSRRWLKLGYITIQPSEFAKIFAVLLLAFFLTEYLKSEEGRRFTAAGTALLALAIPILLQPDLGTAMVFFFLFITLLWVRPFPRRYIFAIFAALAIIALPSWFVLRDYQKERIITFLQPERDILGSGYHVHQSKIAIGSGGIWGKGFLHGTQTQGQFIPVQAADFIFTSAGEEWGLIGCLVILGLYGAFCARIVGLARKVSNEYQRLLAYGVLAVFAFQIFINVGMTLGIAPVTGIPLPFLSAGGSSMLTMWALAGILASLERYLPAGRG